ncbi:MAG: sigma-70 family RNA polymerase sigma factor [Flavobacteriia bacterium]|nr:sigma-70 family RNA polymerase sigma factor [Flavobacteriia bacterium]
MNMKLMDDRELISLYTQGNEQAFKVLLLRHKSKIFRFINMKLNDRDLSEDIFQETFIKIINTFKLGNYNEEGKFLPWAMRISHNLIIDHFRRTNKVQMVSESTSLKADYNIFNTLKFEDDNVEERITKSELVSQMVELVEHLPDMQRDILKMRLFQDLSFKDIADKEDISINTALGRMRYALINLRKLIEKHQLVVD